MSALVDRMKEVSDQLVDGLVLMKVTPDEKLLQALLELAQEMNEMINVVLDAGKERG